MKFFIPKAKNEEEAEQVYLSIAKFVSAPFSKQRIFKLDWNHNNKDMSCQVGSLLPAYYKMGEEPVLIIFDCGDHFKICTPNRGGLRGEPVLAEKDWQSKTILFEDA